MDTNHSRHDDDVVMGSDRNFGLVFTVLFAVIGLWPLWHAGQVRSWALAVALMFLAAAFLAPAVLRPLNILWFRFGLLLGKVMTPVVMGLIYILTVVPIGILMRLAGKDVLRLGRLPEVKSYWIMRDAPGPERGSMKQQF